MSAAKERVAGTIRSEVADGIGWLTIDNPARRNAVSVEMAVEGAAAVARFVDDPEVRVIVVAGAGDRAFMSGADIGDMDKRLAEGTGRAGGLALYHGLRAAPKPVVASIRGYCMGGGVALACACDLRIVADDAVFAVPAARLGVAYRPDFTRWMVEAIGAPATKEMLITARRYDAAEALRIGLASRVVPAVDLAAFTRDYAAAIAANAPLSTRAGKAIVNEVAKSPSDWDLALCEALAATCSGSEDFAEGRRAFLEKRAPAFRGC